MNVALMGNEATLTVVARDGNEVIILTATKKMLTEDHVVAGASVML
jgi:hypothetical protein